MTDSPADLQAAWTQGTQALREGRNADAVRHLQRITASGQATGPVWVAMVQLVVAGGCARAAVHARP